MCECVYACASTVQFSACAAHVAALDGVLGAQGALRKPSLLLVVAGGGRAVLLALGRAAAAELLLAHTQLQRMLIQR